MGAGFVLKCRIYRRKCGGLIWLINTGINAAINKVYITGGKVAVLSSPVLGIDSG